jgi:hypothetical protein
MAVAAHAVSRWRRACDVAPLFRDGADIWRRLTPFAGDELGQPWPTPPRAGRGPPFRVLDIARARIAARAAAAAAVADDMVVMGAPLAAAAPLSPAESRLVQILRQNGPVAGTELRLGQAAGLSRPTLRRLMRSSPLLERLPDRSFILVGMGGGSNG